MRKRDISLPSCVVTGQRLCISLKDFMVYFPSTPFNFLLALILKLLPHFTESFHFSFHLALFFFLMPFDLGSLLFLLRWRRKRLGCFWCLKLFAFKITQLVASGDQVLRARALLGA